MYYYATGQMARIGYCTKHRRYDVSVVYFSGTNYSLINHIMFLRRCKFIYLR